VNANDLTETQKMLLADALIEYGFKYVKDEALFTRTVAALETLGYTNTAASLNAYRQSLTDLAGDDFLVRAS
jgi:hypothetical protein